MLFLIPSKGLDGAGRGVDPSNGAQQVCRFRFVFSSASTEVVQNVAEYCVNFSESLGPLLWPTNIAHGASLGSGKR